MVVRFGRQAAPSDASMARFKNPEYRVPVRGFHQVVVDAARIRQCFLDRFFRDLVEHQAVHGHLGLEQLVQMPTYGFPFAVLVRGQIQVFGVFEKPFELADLGCLAGRNDVVEVAFGSDLTDPGELNVRLLDLRIAAEVVAVPRTSRVCQFRPFP